METDKRIEIIQGDITQIHADAIVNAANSSLLGGGGVDGAIHRAGGKKIQEECILIRNRRGGCPTGQAVITTGGNLPSRYVIHTVGPVWRDGKHGEEKLLAECYTNSLKLASENDIHTLAFPNISTGVYHFPKPLAAKIAIKTVTEFLNTHQEEIIKKAWFVCFDEENYRLYEQLLKE